MTDLERRYRRLLLAYPRWYRQRRGEEMLTTLLEGSRPGQRRPAAGQAVALLVHGAATRLDLGEGGALGATAAAAASPTLAAAAVLSLAALIFGELFNARPAGWPPLQRMGPFLTLGWVAYLAWIAAFVLDLATASRLQRPAVAVAVTVTVLVIPLGDAIGPGRPLLSVLAALVVLGLPSLLRPGWTRARPSARSVVLGAAATLALLAATGAIALTQPSHYPLALAGYGFYQVWLGQVLAAWTPVVMLATATAVVALAVTHRSTLAATLGAWTLPWLVLSVGHAPRPTTRIVSLVLFSLLMAAAAAIAASSQRRLRNGETTRPQG